MTRDSQRATEASNVHLRKVGEEPGDVGVIHVRPRKARGAMESGRNCQRGPTTVTTEGHVLSRCELAVRRT